MLRIVLPISLFLLSACSYLPVQNDSGDASSASYKPSVSSQVVQAPEESQGAGNIKMLDAAAEASAEKSKNERSSISTFDEQTPPKEDTLELEATTQTYASPVPYVLQPTEHTSQHNQQEYVKESPSLTRYLDSFFYGNHNPQKTNKKASGRDFSAYGFITPTESLETLVNEELASLRETSTTDADSNLFDRIRAGFQLDLSSQNPRLEQQLRWYVNNPDYLDRTFSRAARYLHHIVEELEREGMPLELALLPLVESAYDPFAYSHGRASGLWQFIPGTGRIYGMYQTWWYDGRRDVLASTEGAIQYLKYLNKRFDGNWLHALAAYNSGSGRVSSAIRKNKAKGKPTDFWSLKLPRETRAYVPKLLAIAKVVANPKQYNISLNPIPDRPYFEVVNIEAQMDLAHAAELAQIDIEELYRLNPGFNQWATDPLGPHRLLIPVDAAETFRTALSQLNPDERITWKRYTVKSGDSLIKIAKRFQTTPSLIQQVNKLRSNLIRVNQKLLIPVASQQKQFYQLSEANRLASKQSTYRGSNGSIKIVHEVQPGDTLWELARMHKVSSRSIAKWNGKAPTDVLQPGQKLVIWSRADVNTALPASSLPQIAERDMIKRIGYRVRKGDSLARIASKFSVTIKDLINWNNLDSNKYLQPGQKLTIYVDITNS